MDGEITPASDWALSRPIEQSLARDLHQKTLTRRSAVAFAISLAALCTTMAAIGLLQSVGPLASVCVCATLWNGLLYVSHSGRLTDLAFERQQALTDEFGAVGGWIVEITLYQGGAVTGKDEGVVWFEEGRLYFSGYRTSFGLGPEDVASGIKQRKSIDGIRSPLSLDLKASTVAGKVSIGFSTPPSEPSKHSPAFVLERFTMTTRKWLEKPTGVVGQAPPLTVGPGAPSPTQLLRRALVATIFWGLIAALAINVRFFGGPIIPLLPVVIPITAFCSEVWYPVRRWRIWLARRRLGEKT